MIAVLFAMKNSIYHSFPECDVYDLARDARTFPGGCPVIAHPPCRLWGNLAHLSTVPAELREEEKDLARFAVQAIRENGGVLEHPAGSKLWADQNLPRPGPFRGSSYTISVNQHWWGHRAQKKTWLWIYGLPCRELPPHPLQLNCPGFVVCSNGHKRPEIPHREREATPPAFAEWLIDVAKRTEGHRV